MENMLKTSIILLCCMITPSIIFAWDNICELAKDTPYITSVQLTELYKDNIKGRMVEGRGIVRNVWEYGVNKNHAVRVDCGNNVIVNVATSSHNLTDIKTGQEVSFEGKVINYDRRRYVNTKVAYTIFELDGGSVR